MKWLGVMLLVVGLVVAVGIAQEVTSVNVVGYNKVTMPGNGAFTLVAVNFDAIDPANANVKGIFGTQLRAGASPTSADKLYIYSPTTLKYTTLARKLSDGEYHNTVGFSSNPATNPAMTAGEAIWLKSYAGAPALDITIMGEVVAVSTQEVPIQVGWQLLGYGFSSEIALNDLAFLQSGATAGATPTAADNIYLYNGSAYDKYALKASDGKWHSTVGFSSNPATTNKIDIGKGFWYQARNAFTWKEPCKYLGNL